MASYYINLPKLMGTPSGSAVGPDTSGTFPNGIIVERVEDGSGHVIFDGVNRLVQFANGVIALNASDPTQVNLMNDNFVFRSDGTFQFNSLYSDTSNNTIFTSYINDGNGFHVLDPINRYFYGPTSNSIFMDATAGVLWDSGQSQPSVNVFARTLGGSGGGTAFDWSQFDIFGNVFMGPLVFNGGSINSSGTSLSLNGDSGTAPIVMQSVTFFNQGIADNNLFAQSLDTNIRQGLASDGSANFTWYQPGLFYFGASTVITDNSLLTSIDPNNRRLLSAFTESLNWNTDGIVYFNTAQANVNAGVFNGAFSGDGSSLTGYASFLNVGNADTAFGVSADQISVNTINSNGGGPMVLALTAGGFKNTSNNNFIFDLINGLYYADSFSSVLSADLVSRTLNNTSSATVFSWAGAFITGDGSGLNPAVTTSNSTATATFNTSKQSETIYETSTTLIAALTIALPSTTIIGQILRYVSNRVVTAVTVTGTVVAGPALTTFGAAGVAAWQAVDTSGTFIRIQ